jgi:hypothetical protein
VITKGVWHQFGHNSQTLALEQLQQGIGVGVIISPRDLKLERAEERSVQYRALSAKVLLDYQFYVPDFTNQKLTSYALDDFRNSVNSLRQVGQQDLDTLSSTIEEQNRRLATTAVIAPAVLYEANRPERLELNTKLFEAAKRAGDAIGVPTLATVGLAHSTVVSPHSISDALSHATGLACDGWYFLFEFSESRIPCERAEVLSCGSACLTLAANLKPVIHAYAGPMALLSFGFGATAAGIGHSQTLWQFDRSRWAAPVEQQGGPGATAPRFFSSSLWGTVIYSDEVIRIPPSVRSLVMTHSPHSQVITDPATHGTVEWSRHLADKHLVHVLGETATSIAARSSARASAQGAIEHLAQAGSIFTSIQNVPVLLKQESQCVHQTVWRGAMQQLLAERSDDYDLLELMS